MIMMITNVTYDNLIDRRFAELMCFALTDVVKAEKFDQAWIDSLDHISARGACGLGGRLIRSKIF